MKRAQDGEQGGGAELVQAWSQQLPALFTMRKLVSCSHREKNVWQGARISPLHGNGVALWLITLVYILGLCWSQGSPRLLCQGGVEDPEMKGRILEPQALGHPSNEGVVQCLRRPGGGQTMSPTCQGLTMWSWADSDLHRVQTS